MNGQCGIIFVHGINNGPNERPDIKPRLEAALHRFGVRNLFTLISVAEWRSKGDFALDLLDLCSPLQDVRRNEAVRDVALQIGAVIEELCKRATDAEPPDTVFPRLLVVGHSMGQVISRMALEELAKRWKDRRRAPIPISLLTLGGPIGNPDMAVQKGLHWVPESCKMNVPPAWHLVEWRDGINREDPIPCLPVFGTHHNIPGTLTFEAPAPGHPTPGNPLAEHGSYFVTPHAFEHVNAMVDVLTDASRRWGGFI